MTAVYHDSIHIASFSHQSLPEYQQKCHYTTGVIFAITGESVEEIGKSIAYLGNEKCMAGGDTVVMKHNQDQSRWLQSYPILQLIGFEY